MSRGRELPQRRKPDVRKEVGIKHLAESSERPGMGLESRSTCPAWGIRNSDGSTETQEGARA